MKNLSTISAVLASLLASADLNALPIHWDVELTAQPPQVFTLQRPRGETYELEAVLKSSGKPFAPAITNAFIYWQTNGMDNLYWSAPAFGSNNVLRASWLPSMDPGATTVRGYIGDPGHIYAAAFQFRFISSPGATPNELPLPQKVIDFAKVTVLNPPWSGGGGGGGGVDTNAVIDIIHKTVDGSARTLPPYLHYIEMDDTYPDAAAEWYARAVYSHGSCSSVRDGNTLSRNYDWNFDFMPEFVVRTVAASATGTGTRRYASLAVCNVGTNLTEADVTSGKWSRWYKALPGHAVDGINENGVVAEINVVGGNPQTSGWRNMCDIHPLGAVRWALDNGKSAEDAATNLAARITFPSGWTQNFHYMVCDERETWIVENGSAHDVTDGVKVLTNFRLYPTRDTTGEGQERYDALASGANITSQWWTLTYTADGYRASDLPGITGDDLPQLFNYWENNPRESHRGETFPTGTGTENYTWWQTVHTSVYDISNRVLRVAVQEVDDWYTFQVPSACANVDLAPIVAQLAALQDGKRDYDDLSYNRGIGPGHGTFNVTEGGTLHEELVWHGYAPTSDEWLPRTAEFQVDCAVKPIAWPRVAFYSPIDQSVEHEFNALEGDEFDLTIETPIGTTVTFHIKVDPYVPDSVDNLAKVSQLAEAIAANEKTGTNKEIVRGLNYGGMGGYNITVEFASRALDAKNADFAESDYEGNNIAATYAKKTELSATDETFSNAVMGVASHTNAAFAAEVLAVQVASLSTNITAEVYIAATNACANLGIDPALIPQGGTLGTVGGLLVTLAAAVALLRKKTAHLENDGTADDDFATELLGKQVAKDAIAYKVATTAGENRSVLVVEIAETATAAVNVVVPAPVANKVIDFEVWVKVAARSTDIPQINYGYMVDETFTPVTLIKKGGENPAYEKDASATVTNIVHFTSSDASGYTVVAAAFK